jgi:hypothetical protein
VGVAGFLKIMKITKLRETSSRYHLSNAIIAPLVCQFVSEVTSVFNLFVTSAVTAQTVEGFEGDFADVGS